MTVQYEYDPHKHIKIWLSKNPAIFMNFENQMRLIEMRVKNPKDEINLVYDSSLLNEQALQDLDKFCKENDIKPVDIEDFSTDEMTVQERQLFAAYKDEIQHLNEGGNLAVASDILRWIKPVYSLGTYTDFDVPVDTSSLPKLVQVDSPLLLNIGSLKLGNNELIISNNDYIAIVDGEAGKEQIEKVQKGILDRLNEYDSDFIESATKKLGGDSFLYSRISSYMKNRAESEYIEKSRQFNSGVNTSKNPPMSSRELRQFINNVTKDPDSFWKFRRKGKDDTKELVVKRLRKNLSDSLGVIKWFFFNKEYREIKAVLAKSDDEVLKYLMKKERSLYMKSIVVCTTGPVEIAKCLFNGYVLKSSEFDKDAAPMSFNHYGLKKAFQSQNSIPMHETPLGMLKFLGAADGELNDSSWLEEGVQLQQSRQERLLEKQRELQSNLPSELQTLRAKAEENIKRIEDKSTGFFSFFGRRAREAKLEALQKLLKCFHDDTHEFSIDEYRTLLVSIHEKRKDVFAGVFFSRTQDIVEKLEKACTEALVFRVAKDGKSLNFEDQPANDCSLI
ncbi:glycosyltransferase family 88 protein [Legionella yabuuchiae]|uniref:glycosyltransferase family 88 protein n=1 Tax=Legionella yabuuchiae TaxID=376727 RepID=UPI0013EF62E1|nr:glycosyltransferase family 88 protein [Legionella yabuuchiae]